VKEKWCTEKRHEEGEQVGVLYIRKQRLRRELVNVEGCRKGALFI